MLCICGCCSVWGVGVLYVVGAGDLFVFVFVCCVGVVVKLVVVLFFDLIYLVGCCSVVSLLGFVVLVVVRVGWWMYLVLLLGWL